jgi:putative transposase
MDRTPASRQLTEQTFFVTTVSKNRARLFTTNQAVQTILNSLQFFRRRHEIELYGYLIMPDHLHAILKPLAPLILPAFMRRFKSYVAHATARGKIWDKGYWSQALPNEKIFLQKLRYIHENPVRKGLVAEAADYPWSSANEYCGDGLFTLIDGYRGPDRIAEDL